jgi:hypothetical protein
MECRAITIHQPYAALIVAGIKDIENRGWDTRHRGRIYIHAAKVQQELEPRDRRLVKKHGLIWSTALLSGMWIWSMSWTGIKAVGSTILWVLCWRRHAIVPPALMKGQLGIWRFPESALCRA